MDYDVAEQNVPVYGDDDHHLHEYEEDYQHHRQHEDYPEPQLHQQQHHGSAEYDSVDDSSAQRHDLKHAVDDSSAGKLFVGGIAWETSEESFTRYFSKYGEISDSVIMMDKISGRPRGFGFVTFSDPEVVNKVLEEDHVIDGRVVEVKMTVPREDMQTKGVSRTKKIFVGGLPLSLTEDDLKEYFSSYGHIIEHQIMLDHKTGRSRGFGFVTFESEDAVERILSDGRMHELGGKRVEIKKAEPKRGGFDFGNDRRNGSSSKSYGGFGGDAAEFGGGYGGKMGRGYGGGGGYGGFGVYGGYGNYAGNYGGGGAGFYGGYGGYGYGFSFGAPMYGGAGYGGGGYGNPAGFGFGGGGYGGGKAYAGSGYDGGKGYGVGGSATGYGGSKGYGGVGGAGIGSGGGAGIGSGGGGSKAYGNGGSAPGRFHPYRK